MEKLVAIKESLNSRKQIFFILVGLIAAGTIIAEVNFILIFCFCVSFPHLFLSGLLLFLF